MKKYLSVSLVLVVLIVLGVFYGTKAYLPQAIIGGPVKHVIIRIPLHSWSFEPEHIEAKQGDRISITLVNADDIAHGFAIEEYRVRQSVEAFATTTLPQFVVRKEGKFQFYCSEICGDGTAQRGTHRGENRGHFDMAGTLEVAQ